jgi:hypothetical protein
MPTRNGGYHGHFVRNMKRLNMLLLLIGKLDEDEVTQTEKNERGYQNSKAV